MTEFERAWAAAFYLGAAWGYGFSGIDKMSTEEVVHLLVKMRESGLDNAVDDSRIKWRSKQGAGEAKP